MPHALLWRRPAASVVNLHQYLVGLDPKFVDSLATGGDVAGYCGGVATDGQHSYAILWTPIPEPSTAALFCCGLFVAALRRRCWRPRHF